MSASLLRPGDFQTELGQLPIPSPSEFRCEYACLMIGTNDAMAICGGPGFTDLAFPRNAGGSARLPLDWKTSCPPSVEAFEKNLHAAVKEIIAANPGVHIALVTTPPLGEEVTEKCEKVAHSSPFLVVSGLVAAVRRIAVKEKCAVLPLFECMVHSLTESEQRGRKLIGWTPRRLFRADDKSSDRICRWRERVPQWRGNWGGQAVHR